MRKSGGVRDEVREEGRGGGSEQALDLDQGPYQCSDPDPQHCIKA